MKKVIFLIACFSIAIFAQEEQEQPVPQQIPQEQSVSPPQQQQAQQQQVPQPPPEQSVNLEQRAKVQRLIKKGIAENKEEIQKEALSLSFKDKQYLYKRNKIWAVPYAILNFVPGLGIGSYIQGDTWHGLAQTALDIAGGLVFLAAAGSMWGTDDTCSGEGTGCLITSLTIYGASRIAGLIFPFSYQKKHNKALDEALNLNNFSYSIDPLIVPRDGAPAVGLAFNVRY